MSFVSATDIVTIKLPTDFVEKLVPNLNNKYKYVVHYRNLQYYLQKGLRITQWHRILQYKQSN